MPMLARKPRLRSIFAHFLNRETLSIFGANANIGRGKLIEILAEYLNVAAFLTDEYCVVPPGWIDESSVAKEVLERRHSLLLSGLVRLPMRETTLEEFHQKRLSQYGPYRAAYPDLFLEENVLFLEENAEALIGRESGVGARIRAEWLDQSLAAAEVREFAESLSRTRQKSVTKIASEIAGNGAAIVWPGIEERMMVQAGNAPQGYRHLLQRLNFETYILEYGLRLVSGLPLARYDFGLGNADLRYDYRALRAALLSAQAWSHVQNMDGESLVQLRATRGFIDFRAAFDDAATTAGTAFELQRQFAAPPRRLMRLLEETADLERASERASARPGDSLHLSAANVMQLSLRLEAAAATASSGSAREAQVISAAPTGEARKRKLMDKVTIPGRRPRVGVFVALEVELRVLEKRWKLKNVYGDRSWAGTLGDADVTVFSSYAMGRVQAALESFEMLAKVEPFDIFLVLGLAGGFAKQSVAAGSVIIATTVVDLAARKITEDEGMARPIFRPREYALDPRLREYLQSGSFDRREWLAGVVEEEDWPDGLRPVLHFGPIGSGDEVVSSTDWAQRLTSAWPQLLGVEMEAGGVCAAAERLNSRVAVARVISDFADPAKADDAWRTRGMRTLANLLEFLDFGLLCRRL
jgi:nucleoside phosphorylase